VDSVNYNRRKKGAILISLHTLAELLEGFLDYVVVPIVERKDGFNLRFDYKIKLFFWKNLFIFLPPPILLLDLFLRSSLMTILLRVAWDESSLSCNFFMTGENLFMKAGDAILWGDWDAFYISP
jgi:hypothetical protein